MYLESNENILFHHTRICKWKGICGDLLLLHLCLLHAVKNDERRRYASKYDITAVNYQSLSTKVKLNDNFKKKRKIWTCIK